MKFLVPAALLFLTSCATPSPLDPPVVDTRGHEATYAADQNECIGRQVGKTFIAGAPITECMRSKGYTILVPKG